MDKNVADKLFIHRKANGLSQEELAEKIGVSRQAVSKWERGETSPDTENLIALAKLYNTSLDELIFGQEASGNSNEEAEAENDHSEKSGDKINVSPKGIHIIEKNGDEIRVGWKGVHIGSQDSDVHIDKNGVNVNKNGHIISSTKPPINSKLYRAFQKFPYPILTVILYVLFGYFNILGGWGLGWLIFLTIPLYYSLITAFARKNASEFAYPVLAVIIYLYIGMVNSLWHPGWLIFLTIPIYYFLAEFIKKLCSKL